MAVTLKAVELLGAAALVFNLAACARYDNQGGQAKVDTDAVKAAITADEKKWSDEFQAKPRSLGALVAHYAQDATFVAPGLKPTRGINDIRKAYEEGLKDSNFNLTFA